MHLQVWLRILEEKACVLATSTEALIPLEWRSILTSVPLVFFPLLII
jgi:hypothetical protein